jgi:type IV fimbrial biogenesis protein FimT
MLQARRARARARGFTLIEMLAVLAMMTVLIYTATPGVIGLMRDRRVNRAAMQIMDRLRRARTMAIGKGQPIVVRWNASGYHAVIDSTAGTGGIQIWEPIVTTATTSSTNLNAPGGVYAPVYGSCLQTAWFTAQTQMVDNFDIQTGLYNYTAVTFQDDTGATQVAYADFCFSGTGRMYLRTVPGGTFHAVLGVPSFAVFNLQTNPGMLLNINTRYVYAPPNGAARMAL